MTTFNCFKCSGTGSVAFRHIANGVCFQCQGTGKLSCQSDSNYTVAADPVVLSAQDRSTDKQWSYLAKLAGVRDTLDIKWFKPEWFEAAGIEHVNPAYISKKDMSRVIDLAKGAA